MKKSRLVSDATRPALIRALLAASLRLDEPVFSPRQARNEDVRALALEDLERQALGRFDATEDDIFPGS